MEGLSQHCLREPAGHAGSRVYFVLLLMIVWPPEVPGFRSQAVNL